MHSADPWPVIALDDDERKLQEGSKKRCEDKGHRGTKRKDEEVVRDEKRIIKNVKSSKVIQMAQELGQKPVLAFGNSTGDTSMFIYTTYSNPYRSAAFCIVPDDDVREYAYPSKTEKLKKTCLENGWYVISMKHDFLSIYGEDVRKNPEKMEYVDHLLSLCER